MNGRWTMGLTGLGVAVALLVGAVNAGGGLVDNDPNDGLIGLAPEHVRADFARGVEALHDFWFEEAAERFRAVQSAAPNFVLGYWGEAMALHLNPFGHAAPPTDRMRAILERLAPTPSARVALASNEHERGYLAALDVLIAPEGTPAERHPRYIAAMGDLARQFPQDLEAQAFFARAILLEAPSFGHSRETQRRTALEARRVLDRDPDHHGGLHYYIHGMDAPDTGPQALAEADRYQDVAVGASHAVHMPSHIYLQMGQWDQVVAGNKAAVRTSEEWIARTGRSLRDLDRHAVDFLIYALLQQGREAEARELLERTAAERAEFDTGGLRWYDALWSARYAMELGPRSNIPLPRSGYASVGETLALGLYALASDEPGLLSQIQSEMAEQTSGDASAAWRIAKLMMDAAASGGDQAVGMLNEAIALQSQLPRPNETPDLPKPPEELLGEVQLAMGHAQQARSAFLAAHERWPARLATRLGLARAAVQLDDVDQAREEYAQILIQLRLAAPDHPAVRESRDFLDGTGGVPAAVRLELLPGRAPGTLPEVETVGTGPVSMVIVPCMSCRWTSFDTFMERNAERYTMHAVTLPGFGGTPVPDLPMNGDQPRWFDNAVEAVVNLIVDKDLNDVVLVGHSYGSTVALGVSAALPDRIRAFINVDGNVTSDRSWFKDDLTERRAQADQTWEDNIVQLSDPEAWRTFNGSSHPDPARRALYHGMFMATPKEVMLQYWRENSLVDTNRLVADLTTPVLDLQAVPTPSSAGDSVRAAYRDQLSRADAPSTFHTVFLGRTSHFVMEQRPELLDRMISEYLEGRLPEDYDAPPGP